MHIPPHRRLRTSLCQYFISLSSTRLLLVLVLVSWSISHKRKRFISRHLMKGLLESTCKSKACFLEGVPRLKESSIILPLPCSVPILSPSVQAPLLTYMLLLLGSYFFFVVPIISDPRGNSVLSSHCFADRGTGYSDAAASRQTKFS